MGLHKLSDSIELVKNCSSLTNFNILFPPSMAVTGDPGRNIQVTLRARLNPEVCQGHKRGRDWAILKLDPSHNESLNAPLPQYVLRHRPAE